MTPEKIDQPGKTLRVEFSDQVEEVRIIEEGGQELVEIVVSRTEAGGVSLVVDLGTFSKAVGEMEKTSIPDELKTDQLQ